MISILNHTIINYNIFDHNMINLIIVNHIIINQNILNHTIFNQTIIYHTIKVTADESDLQQADIVEMTAIDWPLREARDLY